MRRVIGKAVHDLDAEAFEALRAPYDHVLLDLGTGDGKHVLHVARQRPDTLVVGLDSSPNAMVKASARAAAKPARGGLPNAVFVRAAVEQLPPDLRCVTEVHCLMPWGSLLRALVAPDADVMRGIAATCTPDATFLVTLNLHAWRPPVVDVGDTAEPTPASALEQLGPAYAGAGWTIGDAHHAGPDELAALGTSWTKRIGSSRDELAVLAITGSRTHGRAPHES